MPHTLPHHESGGESATQDQRLLISVKEASEMLGLKPWEIYQMCESGALLSGKHGRRRLVSIESVRKHAAKVLAGEAS